MSIEKLFKRYLKEIGVYASSEGKQSIEFMREFSEPFYPFNSFRWDTSEQGHLYWFERAVNWLIFLYNNYDNIETDGFEKEDITKMHLALSLEGLFTEYLPTNRPNLSTFAFYKEAVEILEDNGIIKTLID